MLFSVVWSRAVFLMEWPLGKLPEGESHEKEILEKCVLGGQDNRIPRLVWLEWSEPRESVR